MLHQPVMVREVIDGLDLRSRSVILDATIGMGGHSQAILSHPDFTGNIIGIDQDETHVAMAKINLSPWNNQIRLYQGNFSDLRDLTKAHGFRFDGILFDLGIASPHVDLPERGFSFLKNAPLDMRMNQKNSLTAGEIVNSSSTEELARIFYEFGEEPLGREIAGAILHARKKKQIRTTFDLSDIVKTVYHARGRHYSKRHPATKVFQALRIAVNGELDALKQALVQCTDLLPPFARIVVISYHSLEDRIVKDFFRRMRDPCTCPKKSPVCVCGRKSILRIITKKPVTASREEINSNERSRSAKLRVAEKV